MLPPLCFAMCCCQRVADALLVPPQDEADREAAAAQRRAQPRVQALFSMFDAAPAEESGGPAAGATAASQQPVPNPPGLTSNQHARRARAVVVATWQMRAAPVFLQCTTATRPEVKAHAAALAKALTLAALSREGGGDDEAGDAGGAQC